MAIYTFTEIAEWAESQTGLTYAYMCIHVSIYNTSPLTAQALIATAMHPINKGIH